VRLSDILKKNGSQPSPQAPKIEINPRPQKPARPQADLSFQPKIQILSPDNVYNKAINEIKSVLEHVDKNLPYEEKLESVQELIELAEEGNEDIMTLADKATPDIYLYSHSVNVCIFALTLGKQLEYNEAEQKQLGYTAFLHDLGIIRNISLAQKKGKLTVSEFNIIKKHSQSGKDFMPLLSGIPADIRDMAADTIMHIHERSDGRGYPMGMKGRDILPLAKTLAIVDVYEALTHPRPYRDRYIPHEALKMMIKLSDTDFDSNMLKAFINKISLYPPGSYIRLNTDEIAKVVKLNLDMPTRPVVKVLVTPKGERMTEHKVTDLSTVPQVFIKEAVDETKVDIADKRLALELKAVRWWVKGL
jgi:HD-GYP domain-containing protein (c-di-GMP phosphodiesterase class II)